MTWRAAFALQARHCRDLGSPFTARLLDAIAQRGLPPGAIADRIAAWPGDMSSSGDSVPLRLAGALHGLVLEGRAPALARLYPPALPEPETLWRAAADGILEHEDWLLARLAVAPQTNEVRRSAAIIPAARWLAARFGLPLVLSELGASAGLNLIFDRYALAIGGTRFGPDDAVLTLAPDWQGALPDNAIPIVAERAGTDLSPLDPERDRPSILSYIWPDQRDRFARTETAIAEAARLRPALTRADAADWLATRLAWRCEGHVHLIFHTVAWQYFPAATQNRIEAALAAAGAAATEDAPLARFGMELGGAGEGALLRLHLWPGGVILDLGRADFHGRWVRWNAPPPRKP